MSVLNRRGEVVWRRGKALAGLALACALSSYPAASSFVRAQDASPEGDAGLKAAATAKGRTPPVELTLEILETKIKPRENLWYRITIKNVGDRDVHILDRFLFDPSQLESNTRYRKFTYLVIEGPDGEEVPLAFLGRGLVADMPLSKADPLISDLNSKVSEWRGQGLSDEAIEARLSEYAGSPHVPSRVELAPGSTVQSVPWAYAPYYFRGKKPPEQRLPRGQFTELPFYELETPGRYRIKAVFDEELPEEIRRVRKNPEAAVKQGAVRVETSWIEIRVGS